MSEAVDTIPVVPSRMFRTLLFFDAALYIDVALRWELGLGFCLHWRWLLVLLLVGAVFWVFDRVAAGLELSGWLHGLLAFPLWCWAFMMASTGNPYFDWRALPIADFFRISWLDTWLEGGGFLTAGIAAAAHVAFGPGSRSAEHHAPVQLEAGGRRRLGLGLLFAACTTWVPTVILQAEVLMTGDRPHLVNVDPRDVTESKRVALDWVRRAYGGAALGAGVWLLISNKRGARAKPLG